MSRIDKIASPAAKSKPSQKVRPLAREGRRSDPTRQMRIKLIDAVDEGVVILLESETPWSSGLYEGVRYGMAMELTGEDAMLRAQILARDLPERDFDLRQHIVADLSVDAVEAQGDGARLTLTLLVMYEA